MRTSRHSNCLDQKDGSRRGWNGIEDRQRHESLSILRVVRD